MSKISCGYPEAFDHCIQLLKQKPRKWLVTGAAGFIGSHLTQFLLERDQEVVALDNFLTGKRENLNEVRCQVGVKNWMKCQFIEGDITDIDQCQQVSKGVDIVLHQAALGSVPRSIEHPLDTHRNNVNGFINLLVAAKEAGVKRFVYASSSSVYGDHPSLLRQENILGSPLSPYALSKLIDEQYASVFSRVYGMEQVGLRYFNVFGPRQNPAGPYAAVIPKWILALLKGGKISIYGDGETSRDFCYVDNVVQANILAALTTNRKALNQVYNVGVNTSTTLNQLFLLLKNLIWEYYSDKFPHVKEIHAEYKDFRPGDVRHAQADIHWAQTLLGYNPTYDVKMGLNETLPWFMKIQKPGFGL